MSSFSSALTCEYTPDTIGRRGPDEEKPSVDIYLKRKGKVILDEEGMRFLSLAYLGLVDFHLVFLSSIQDWQSFDLYWIEIESIEIIIVLIRILWLS